MSFLLTAIGTIFLLASLLGIAFGVYMSTHPKTRESGRLFAAWWVPAVGASLGILMRDPVTFVIGLLCFLVAGVAFLLTSSGRRTPRARDSRNDSQSQNSSARTTRENRTRKGYRRAAS